MSPMDGVVPGPAVASVSRKCIHFGECGGCQRQDVPYEQQLNRKHEAVRQALRGQVDDISPIIPSPTIWYYRNKMEFTFSKDDKGAVTLGLHRRFKWAQVVNLIDCLIQSEQTNKVLSAAREFCAAKGYTVYDPKTHQGFLRHMVIRDGKHTGDLLVHMITHDGALDVDGFRAALDKSGAVPTGLVWSINTKLSDVAIGEETRHTWGRPGIFEKVCGLSLRISPYAFSQTNTLAAEQLYMLVGSHVKGFSRVVDLYTGIGTIAFIAVQHGAAEVFGVDSSRDCIQDAEFNRQQNDMARVRFLCDDAAEGLLRHGLKQGSDCIVLDPPRSGITRKVAQRVLAMSPQRIIYISCNVKLLGVDLLRFFPRYRPTGVTPVDLFPHTDHIETVVVLDRG